ERLKGNPVLLQLPIGAEDQFRGVIDLVKMKEIIWDEETQGVRFEEVDIPDELKAQAETYREQLVEAAAEGNEQLLEKYLEGERLTQEEVKKGLRARCLRGEIAPVLCGSAFKNKGVQAVLDAVVDYLPSPKDIPPVKGILEDQTEGERAPD